MVQKRHVPEPTIIIIFFHFIHSCLFIVAFNVVEQVTVTAYVTSAINSHLLTSLSFFLALEVNK